MVLILIQKNNLKCYIKSLRHYLLNKNKPIYGILHKNRFTKKDQIFQLVKHLTNSSKFTPSSIINVKNKRIGISVTKNQTNALLKHCDLIIIFDRRAFIKDDKTIMVFFASSPLVYLKSWLSLFFYTYNSNYFRYIDILALIDSFDFKKLKSIISKSKGSIYVSNLNNPIIFYLISNNLLHRKYIHLPHSEIGNTVLPKGNLVSRYFCKSYEETMRMKEKYPKGRYIKYKNTKKSYIGSTKRKIMLVLPKNWYDINWDMHSFLNVNLISIKVHPASNIIEKLKIYLFIVKKYGFLRTTFKSKFNYSYSMYCASSAAIFDLLRSGKYVNFLTLKQGVNDHYHIPNEVYKLKEDNKINWEKQYNLICSRGE